MSQCCKKLYHNQCKIRSLNYVCNFVFVDFTGLVHRSQISRSKVDDPTEMFTRGETIYCKVISVQVSLVVYSPPEQCFSERFGSLNAIGLSRCGHYALCVKRHLLTTWLISNRLNSNVPWIMHFENVQRIEFYLEPWQKKTLNDISLKFKKFIILILVYSITC